MNKNHFTLSLGKREPKYQVRTEQLERTITLDDYPVKLENVSKIIHHLKSTRSNFVTQDHIDKIKGETRKHFPNNKVNWEDTRLYCEYVDTWNELYEEVRLEGYKKLNVDESKLNMIFAGFVERQKIRREVARRLNLTFKWEKKEPF
jgi:hypothetical protein